MVGRPAPGVDIEVMMAGTPPGETGTGGGRAAEEEREAIERAEQWTSSFKPCNVWELWLVDRIAVESLRIERCTRQEAAMRAHLAGRARVLWDDDRAVDALELAGGMARAPELTRAKLELSSRGCDWLLDRWRVLLPVAEGGSRWDEAQRALAFDLLGTGHALRGTGSALPGDPAHQAELARGEIARLEARKRDRLARVEAEARALAEQGVGPEIDRQVRALRRYEAQCLRRLEWAFDQFKKGRHDHRPEAYLERPRWPAEPPRPAPRPEPAREPARPSVSPGFGPLGPEPFGAGPLDRLDLDLRVGQAPAGTFAQASPSPDRWPVPPAGPRSGRPVVAGRAT